MAFGSIGYLIGPFLIVLRLLLLPPLTRLLPLATLALAIGALSARANIEKREVDFDYVRKLAAERAAAAYEEPDRDLPESLAKLSYDQIRDIRFRPAQALWRKEELPFHLHLFHRTGAHREAVAIREFSATHVQTIPFIRDFYDYGKLEDLGWLRSSLGYAGFRIHAQVNRPDYYDELAVFLGASYFRALGANQLYGLSARGLAVDSGISGITEEFPVFTDFWLGKPRPGTNSLKIYALLDSKRVAGAYEFDLKPGATTWMDIRCELHYRDSIEAIGIAPLTSMFWFGKNADRPSGDLRPEVHDSDGLLVHDAVENGHVWRPLKNPGQILNSDFPVKKLERFGLVQRERAIHAYEDLEASYHRRPTAWVEAVGDWGSGRVRLVEMPTPNEYADNIVAYWIPDEKPAAGKTLALSYRLAWSLEEPVPGNLARIVSMRDGHLPDFSPGRLFWIDFAGADIERQGDKDLTAHIVVGPGVSIRHQTLFRHPGINGWRLALQIQADGGKLPEKPVELRAHLRAGYNTVSENWAYTWTP
jgi:periplasmic glucans biosynthesis protein